MSFAIRPIDTPDYAAWKALWRRSVAADGTLDDAAIDATWTLLKAGTSPMGIGGLVATDVTNDDDARDAGHGASAPSSTSPNALCGLLHYVVHPVAGAVAPVCYLQDVYVDPPYRRKGVGSALLAMLGNMGDALGWDRIYWLVEGRNDAAKAFYKGHSVNVDFDLHVLPLRLLKDMQGEAALPNGNRQTIDNKDRQDEIHIIVAEGLPRH